MLMEGDESCLSDSHLLSYHGDSEFANSLGISGSPLFLVSVDPLASLTMHTLLHFDFFLEIFPTSKIHDLSHSLDHSTFSTWTDLARSPPLDARVAHSILLLSLIPAWITLYMLFHGCVGHSVGHISGSRTAASPGWRVYDFGRCCQIPLHWVISFCFPATNILT